MLFLCDQGSSTDDTELLIFMLVCLVLIVLLLPESLLAVAGGIIVRGARAVTLFPLTCAAEDDFKSCGDEEQTPAAHMSKIHRSIRDADDDRRAYAAAMATANTALCSWQETCCPSPIGELLVVPQLLAPPLARTAMATKQPQKRMSRSRPRKAKKVMPPRKQVRMTAKPV